MIHPDDEPCRDVDFDTDNEPSESPHGEEQSIVDHLERPIDDGDPGDFEFEYFNPHAFDYDDDWIDED